MYSIHDEIFCNERRRMEGAVSRYSFVPRYSFSGLMRKKEREREEKIGGDGISDIEIYESVGQADKVRRVNDRKRGRVYWPCFSRVFFFSQSSSCLYPPWALLIHYENFSKTNEWICCEFQEARHYRRWLRERNQFSSLVRFLFCATRYMTLYRELPIAAEIRWNSADATSTPLLSSPLHSSPRVKISFHIASRHFIRCTRKK